MVTRITLEQVYQFLLIALAFVFPLTTTGGSILSITIIVLWLFSGDYRSKFDQILDNKVSLACLAFFALHVVGLLWTEDIEWGLHIIKKMSKFLLLLPILLTITRNEHRQNYMSAFLLAMTISELCSYLIWFEVIPPFKHASVGNPTPFVDHISYNPLLAFAVYLLSHELLMNKCLSRVRRYTYLVIAITMSINMFITGGRAGHVMYFSMLVILIFQYFEARKITAFFTTLIVVPALFLAAYQLSPLFKHRTDSTVHTVVDYLEKRNSSSSETESTTEPRFKILDTSVGKRMTFVVNSFEIFKNNPLFGVGTGDFPGEYKTMNQINTPHLVNTSQPHNMYALEAVQFGVLGLFGLLAIFYHQFKCALSSSDRFTRYVGTALPALFMIIMLSDSYLLGHFTTFLFTLFSSFLYKIPQRTGKA